MNGWAEPVAASASRGGSRGEAKDVFSMTTGQLKRRAPSANKRPRPQRCIHIDATAHMQTPRHTHSRTLAHSTRGHGHTAGSCQHSQTIPSPRHLACRITAAFIYQPTSSKHGQPHPAPHRLPPSSSCGIHLFTAAHTSLSPPTLHRQLVVCRTAEQYRATRVAVPRGLALQTV